MTLSAVNLLRVLCVSTDVPQQRESKSHQTLQPAKMKAVSLSEELNPKPPMEATDKYHTHTHAHKDTKARRQIGTHTLWGGSVCSAQSCCLQVDETVRAESSVVVLYCYCPEAAPSSINDAQLPVGQILLLSLPPCTVSMHTHTHTHPHACNLGQLSR